MFIYIASTAYYAAKNIVKIGCTWEPYSRLRTYLTGCPPSQKPSTDIEYLKIWKTNAKSRDELYDYEMEVHNKFYNYRLMRNIPGDTEWFDFGDLQFNHEIQTFISQKDWILEEVRFNDIPRPKQHNNSTLLSKKQTRKNLLFIKTDDCRLRKLNEIQLPVIEKIREFIANNESEAGIVIAPCGSGKTTMSVKAIVRNNIRKCLICCPSRQIQEQWKNTLIRYCAFEEANIKVVGMSGTTDSVQISNILESEKFCIIATYMSSNLLMGISNAIELLVLDEAHHMAGLVADKDEGLGKTRKLVLHAATLKIKRLSLTYTPRIIDFEASNNELKYLTMDDPKIFGSKIAELNLRDLIKEGVLPDYRIWLLKDQDQSHNGLGMKAKSIYEAWKAKEIYRGEERYIINHLVVFGATNNDADFLAEYFNRNISDTLILRAKQGDNLSRLLNQFSEAKRSILVNCKVLSEGVDIPIADSVAITYPKDSKSQLIQMLLRAGRWYKDKTVFHILIPTTTEEDMSSLETVLVALGSCDSVITHEVSIGNISTKKKPECLESRKCMDLQEPEHIIIDQYTSDINDIKRCFTNIQKKLLSSSESKYVKKLCLERKITTSVEYRLFRQQEFPMLPEMPVNKGTSWFDFLNPYIINRIQPIDLVRDYIEPLNLRTASKYDEWHKTQNTMHGIFLPSVQNITDGYFGDKLTNFNSLIDEYCFRKTGRRGR